MGFNLIICNSSAYQFHGIYFKNFVDYNSLELVECIVKLDYWDNNFGYYPNSKYYCYYNFASTDYCKAIPGS